MTKELLGIINIGASAFRMVITEYSKNEFNVLEYLIKPLRLGIDTFSQGYISLEHVKQATEILCNFRKKLDEYKIKNYRALCTSGVREASNKDFFIDYIRINAGIDLEVLEPSEEVYIKYLAAKSAVKNFDAMEKKGVVFANIASGNVTLCVAKGDKILYSGTLPYGSLRLRQMFLHVPFLKRYKAFDQHVDNMIKTVTATIDRKEKISYLVGGGSSVNLMLRLFNPENDYISKSDILSLYNRVKTFSRPELIEELKIRDDEAAVIIPTLCTYIHLLEFTKSDKFLFTRSNFPVTLSEFYSGKLKDTVFNKRIKNTLLGIAEKYRSNLNHVKKVEKFSKVLFNALEDIHSLTKSDYNILEAAALLHEVGYFIDPKESAQNSHYIIKTLTIPGWKQKTLLLVACTVYQMAKTKEHGELSLISSMAIKERLLINKLACILKTANALDAGKNNLIQDFTVDIRDNMIIIDVKTSKEPFVELAAFEKHKQIFAETFGIPIEIRARVSYE